MDALKQFRGTLDNLPWIVTLLLTIFVSQVYGAIYRLTKGDVVGIVVAVIWFFTGSFFGIGWIIDLVTVITKKKITFLA